MSTNGDSRVLILESASELASQVGLTGLSMGDLARRLRRPRSTISSHFQSKEGLQLAVLRNAARELLRDVIRPAFREPAGLPRLESLVDRWLIWDRQGCYPGGCPFVAIAPELDDQPGRARDHLVRLYASWHHLVESLVQATIATGTFRPDLDIQQFERHLHGILVVYHHHARLFEDPGAEEWARHMFAGLVEKAVGRLDG